MATTVLALLDEPDYALKEYALTTLNAQVNEMWPEISDHIPVIEELHEDADFPARALAALVVAKVYFNLGDLKLALKYALAADSRLDLSQKSEFVDTIISIGIKTYVDQRQRLVDSPQSRTGEVQFEPTTIQEAVSVEAAIDPKLTAVVESMLVRCVECGQSQLALGIAMEARRWT